MEGEIQDWELLQSSDSDREAPIEARNLDGVEAKTEGMIRSDYFSLDNQSKYCVSEEGSVESDNPSWIDPGSEIRYERKNLGGFWSDSSSDRSDERKFSDSDVKNELGLEGIGEMELKSEKLGEIKFDNCKSSDLDGGKESSFLENVRIEFFSGGSVEIQVPDKNLDNCWSDSGEDSLSLMKFGDVEKENEIDLGNVTDKTSGLECSGGFDSGNVAATEIESSRVKPIGDEEKRAVWWKVPLDVLKYCLFRVSPVWSVSMAAAVMGFVILGRRLYKMKRKSRSLQLNVTIDDKKVSQFTSRVARLNEAFSVVKRVPIVRPALPAGSVNPWPVMSMMR